MPPRAKKNSHHLARPARFVGLSFALGLATSVVIAWGGMFVPLPAGGWPWTMGMGSEILTTNTQSISLAYEETSHRVVSRVDFRAVSDYTNWYNENRGPELIAYACLTDNAAFRRAVRRHEALMASPYRYRVAFAVVSAGWPFRCLAYEDACTPAESWGAGGARILFFNPQTGEMSPSPVEFDPLGYLQPFYHTIDLGGTLLPTFPLWPGLIANTAVYGIAWAFLIAAPIFLFRWLRSRRGGCAQCGYSREGLKQDAPCPECGRVPASKAATTPATLQTPTV